MARSTANRDRNRQVVVDDKGLDVARYLVIIPRHCRAISSRNSRPKLHRYRAGRLERTSVELLSPTLVPITNAFATQSRTEQPRSSGHIAHVARQHALGLCSLILLLFTSLSLRLSRSASPFLADLLYSRPPLMHESYLFGYLRLGQTLKHATNIMQFQGLRTTHRRLP